MGNLSGDAAQSLVQGAASAFLSVSVKQDLTAILNDQGLGASQSEIQVLASTVQALSGCVGGSCGQGLETTLTSTALKNLLGLAQTPVSSLSPTQAASTIALTTYFEKLSNLF